MNWSGIALAGVTVVLAPIIGGLLFGLDRKVTARMQGRVGPPLEQPFYDFLKLWGKEHIVVNRAQLIFPYTYLASVIMSLVLLALGQDLLVILMVLALGSVSLILGGFAVKSPYAQIGSQRELLQLLSYEPLLFLAAVGIYMRTGSFLVGSIPALGEPLVYSLPLVVVTLLPVLAIKLRKSPFDISTSHHAHQEVVRGVLTEFSGRQLAVIELTHWYEVVLLLGLVGLFWATSPALGMALALAWFLGAVLVDNISARMTWSWMLRFTWLVGIGLAVVNFAWLYVAP